MRSLVPSMRTLMVMPAPKIAPPSDISVQMFSPSPEGLSMISTPTKPRPVAIQRAASTRSFRISTAATVTNSTWLKLIAVAWASGM